MVESVEVYTVKVDLQLLAASANGGTSEHLLGGVPADCTVAVPVGSMAIHRAAQTGRALPCVLQLLG